MATQKINPQDLESLPAASDLSEKQFYLVKITEAGKIELAGAGDVGFSLQENVAKGNYGTFAVAGRVKAIAGGNIKAGELVSAGAEGKLVAATATKVEEEKVKALGTQILGVALESGASGELVAYRALTGGRA